MVEPLSSSGEEKLTQPKQPGEAAAEYRAEVSERAAERLRGGDARVFDNELTALSEGVPNGAVVLVYSEKGRFIGQALYSACSTLRLRVISRSKQERTDESFWRRRIQYAWRYRLAVMDEDELSACRVIFGEADGFPGLTVDRYEDVLVVQNLAFGLEQRKNLLYRLLLDVLSESGVVIRHLYEKNDLALREKEGLTRGEGFYLGDPRLSSAEPEEVEICENGIRLIVPYGAGQKTGYYLDQKRNRRAFARVARGRRVLECFSNSASFGLNALAAGADYVLSVDASQTALDLAVRQRELNGFAAERHGVLKADVLQLLRALKEGKSGPDWDAARAAGPFDMILLDPPAFAKKRADKRSALRAYEEINSLAMQLLPRGAWLATCTCSHFADEGAFREALERAARRVSRSLRQVEYRQQAPDHPRLLEQAESAYLQFYLFQVV